VVRGIGFNLPWIHMQLGYCSFDPLHLVCILKY
jgi:hypothetical protein